jgi:ABC-type proline/glycine betaine transport system permease subunit
MLALFTYLFIPFEQFTAGAMPVPTNTIPRWQLGLANAAIILVFYGLLGLVGNWFAHQLKIPQTYREGAGWKAWLL